MESWDECWERAVYWFQLAAEQGDAAAQCNLATCFLKGQGVSADREEAIRWYGQAALRCVQRHLALVGIVHQMHWLLVFAEVTTKLGDIWLASEAYNLRGKLACYFSPFVLR